MRHSGRYADSNVNPSMTGQMLHSAQRMQMNSGSGMNQFHGRSDSFRPEEEHQYASTNSEAQWQWDRNGSRGPGPFSHVHGEGQVNNAPRSPFQGQWSDSRQSLERKIHLDSEITTRQQEVDARYDDSALPRTFEGLEQKFLDDISKLAKEQYDAEDAENARHMQRLTEINSQYQEKLSAMRTRQVADREEFLRKESQTRRHEYQQEKISSYNKPNSVPGEYIGFPLSGGYDDGEAHRAAYDRTQANAYNEQAQFSGASAAIDSRGPYPGGRAYNSGGRRF